MAYKVIILYQLYMPSYFLGTFTEYPYVIFIVIFLYFPIYSYRQDMTFRKKSKSQLIRNILCRN